MSISRFVAAGILLLYSFNQANALNNYLTNFRQLVQAVESGDDVRAIVHFDNCLVTEPANQTEVTRKFSGATTRFNFTRYFHAKETINDQIIDTVTTSMSIKIFLAHSSGKSLLLSSRLSVFEDNTATIHMNFFDPVLHKSILVVDWLCDISNGQDDNGLVLFDFF